MGGGRVGFAHLPFLFSISVKISGRPRTDLGPDDEPDDGPDVYSFRRIFLYTLRIPFGTIMNVTIMVGFTIMLRGNWGKPMTPIGVWEMDRYMAMPVRKRNLCIEIDWHLRRMVHRLPDDTLNRMQYIPDDGLPEWDTFLLVMHNTVDAMGTARRGPRTPTVTVTDFFDDTLNEPHINFIIAEWEHRQQSKR